MIRFYLPKAPKSGPNRFDREMEQVRSAQAPALAEAGEEAAEEEARRKTRSMLMSRGGTKTRFASLLGSPSGQPSLLGAGGA